MTVERNDNELVIRIPVESDTKRLQEILDLIRYAELTAKSEASQDDVDELSSRINKDWWDTNRERHDK